MDLLHWIVPPESTETAALYIALALAALLITGVSKGGFGGGIGMLAVPLLLQVAPYKFVLGMWLPVLVACDIATIDKYPRQWNPRAFWYLAPGALAGIVVTTYFLGEMNPSTTTAEGRRLEAWIKLAVAVIAIGFVILQSCLHAQEEAPPWAPTWRISLPAGISIGITTMIAHAAGTIVTMFLLPQKLDKRVFVGTCGRFFFVFNSLKILALVSIGFITLHTLQYGLWLMLLAPPAVWFGSWLNRRLSPRLFVRLIYIFLLLATGKLVWDALKVL